MQDLNQYRLNKLEEEMSILKKEVTPLIERQRLWNEWAKLIAAALIGASAREIFGYISKHIQITLN